MKTELESRSPASAETAGLSGHNLVDGEWLPGEAASFHAVNPVTGHTVEPVFGEASKQQIDRAVAGAETAFTEYRRTSPAQRASFLRAIADALIELDDPLLERASLETGLPLPRLRSERGRTVHQLRMFADVLDEGSWVEARIDPGDATRTPLPRPDVRRMLVPLGPVAVFGASNFPLAFSVPGGDTASALAAGCTIVCKAHPAHPGTSELAARAIATAAVRTGMPAGVFALVHGVSHESGAHLVRHPLITAVGFTGSIRGGRAIFDVAAARPAPIPVYAEMGSINPVFVLPSALDARGDAIARSLVASITAGVGQFCTNPGVILGLRSPSFDRVQQDLATRLDAADSETMLHDGIANAYTASIDQARTRGAELLTSRSEKGARGRGVPTLLRTDVERFAGDARLRDEMFGPVSLVVIADDAAGLERAAEALDGQLTATVHATPADLAAHDRLLRILERKVGRIVFNGVPTGVEVGHAMHHGGPYPATTDARTTSVGTAAIARFARPLCYQDFPDAALPPALRNRNELGIWRLVDGTPTREDVAVTGARPG